MQWQDGGRLCQWRVSPKTLRVAGYGGGRADHTGAGPADNAPISLIAVDFAADR